MMIKIRLQCKIKYINMNKQQANKAKKAAVVAKEAKKEKVSRISLKSRISLV